MRFAGKRAEANRSFVDLYRFWVPGSALRAAPE